MKRDKIFFSFFLVLIIILTGLAVFAACQNARVSISEGLPWSENPTQYNQVMWNLVHHGNLACSINSTSCFLSGKFDLLYFLIAPIYALHPGMTMLLAIGIFFLWVTAIVIYLTAFQITKNSFVSFLIAVLFFLYQPAINLSVISFRDSHLTIPFIALGLLFFLRKDFWPMMVALVLAAFSREDAPLLLLGFSFLALAYRRKLKWILAPGTFGMVYFLIIYLWIMPWLNSLPVPFEQVFRPDVATIGGIGGPNFATYGHFGKTPFQMLIGFFLHFDVVIAMLSRPEVGTFFKDLLSPFFYLPVFSIFSYVPFSEYMITTLSDRNYFASIHHHYFAPIMPFLFAGLAGTLALISGFLNRKIRFSKLQLGSLIVVGLLLLMLWNQKDNLEFFVRGFKAKPKPSPVQMLLAKIPAKADVTAQFGLMQFLSSREKLFVLISYPKTTYIAIDTTGNTWPMTGEDYEANLKRILCFGDYGLIGSLGNNIYVFEKGALPGHHAELFQKLFPELGKNEYTRLVRIHQSKLKRLAQLTQTTPNLIKFGSFEDFNKDQPNSWTMRNWQEPDRHFVYAVTSVESYTGKYSVILNHSQGMADSRWWQEVNVQPNTCYELSGWVKSKDVKGFGSGARLEIESLGVGTQSIFGNSDWRMVKTTLRTKKDQNKIIVQFRLGGYGSPNQGIAFFDDISLKRSIAPMELEN